MDMQLLQAASRHKAEKPFWRIELCPPPARGDYQCKEHHYCVFLFHKITLLVSEHTCPSEFTGKFL